MKIKYLFVAVLLVTAVASGALTKYVVKKKYKHCVESPSDGPLFLIKTAISTFRIKPLGIIHLGSHIGQEKPKYEALGLKNRLWVEADPDTYKRLVKNVAPDATANFAATDFDGKAEFLRTTNEVSSSLLELVDNKAMLEGMGVASGGKVDVITRRLDSYFENNDQLKNYNIMLLDIQGAELKALKGAVNTLKKLDCLIIEVQYAKIYKDSPIINEIDSFMAEHGFVRADTTSAHYSFGDGLYVKADIISSLASNK